MMYVSFSPHARAHEVIIFARPQIVNEDINLVRALASTRGFIALNRRFIPQLRLSRNNLNVIIQPAVLSDILVPETARILNVAPKSGSLRAALKKPQLNR